MTTITIQTASGTTTEITVKHSGSLVFRASAVRWSGEDLPIPVWEIYDDGDLKVIIPADVTVEPQLTEG